MDNFQNKPEKKGLIKNRFKKFNTYIPKSEASLEQLIKDCEERIKEIRQRKDPAESMVMHLLSGIVA